MDTLPRLIYRDFKKQGNPFSWIQCRTGASGVLLGALCEADIRASSACDPNPCEAGGTCVSLASGDGFLCRCPADRDGETCQRCEFSFESQFMAVLRVHVACQR